MTLLGKSSTLPYGMLIDIHVDTQDGLLVKFVSILWFAPSGKLCFFSNFHSLKYEEEFQNLGLLLQ